MLAAMFDWLRRKAPLSPPAVIDKPRGLFSTDEPLPTVSRLDLIESLQSRTFQKRAPKKASFAADGAAMDDMGNGLFPQFEEYGDAISDAQLAWYGSQSFIGFQVCAILAQNPIINKVCSIPARDAVRKGWKITVNNGKKEISPDVLDYLRQRDKDFKIRRHCVQFVRKGKIFGIRLAMFNVNNLDPTFYANPFNADGIKPGTYQGITQLDPYWVSPWLDGGAASDPRATDFYEPTWWQINGMKVHRSHLMIFRGDEVADVLKPTYMYGGLSIPQQVAERVYAAERTANEAPQLALSKRLTAIHVDMAEAIANRENIQAQMMAASYLRNNFGYQLLGEGEQIEQFETSLADFNETMMGQYNIVAAVGRMPVTKLMGTSPKGMDATGEFEEADYHEELESVQEHDLTDLVERHYVCLVKSEGDKVKGLANLQLSITWNPLDAMTEDEQAAVNLKKAQTDQALIGTGALEGQDVRNRLIADPDSGYNGIAKPAPKPPEEDDDVVSKGSSGKESMDGFDPNELRDKNGKWTAGTSETELMKNGGITPAGHGTIDQRHTALTKHIRDRIAFAGIDARVKKGGEKNRKTIRVIAPTYEHRYTDEERETIVRIALNNNLTGTMGHPIIQDIEKQLTEKNEWEFEIPSDQL